MACFRKSFVARVLSQSHIRLYAPALRAPPPRQPKNILIPLTAGFSKILHSILLNTSSAGFIDAALNPVARLW